MSSAFGERDLPRLGRRFVAFVVIGVLLFTMLGGRLFQLQVLEGQVRAAEAEAARTVAVAIPSERGLLFDRAGRPLAINVPTWTVAVRPADLPEVGQSAILGRVARITGIPLEDLQARLAAFQGSPFDLVPVGRDIERDAALLLEEEAGDLPGVELQVTARREYLDDHGAVDGTLLAHVVGYTGPINAEELDRLAERGIPP